MININRYIKSSFRYFFLYCIFSFFVSVFAVMVQFKRGDVLNNALAFDYTLLSQAILLLAVYIFAEILFMQIAFRMENTIVNHTERDMKRDFFGSVVQMEYPVFQSSTIGDYISKFTVMISEIKHKYFSSLTLLIMFCVKIVLVTVALAMLNWKVMLLTLFLLTMPMYLPKLLEKQLQHFQGQYVEKAERFINSLTNILQGFEVIKNFSMEKKITAQFMERNLDVSRTSLKNSNYNSLMRGLMALISYFSYFAIIAFSAYLVFTKEFNAGQFFVAVGMIDQLSYPLIAIAGCIQNIVAVKTLKTEFVALITRKNEDGNTKVMRFNHKIMLDNISFRHKDAPSWLFHGVSFEMQKGGKYLIQGESGCGKTTLINCLLKYHEINCGVITIDNEPLDNIANVYGIFSILRQDVFLFSDSLRNNLALFDDSIKDTAIFEMLVSLGMAKYATAEGLETSVGDGGVQLSGGERRRIGLARVLLSSKDIVILDEPLANLDVNTKETIKRYISSIKGKTVLVVSHEWSNNNDNDKRDGFDRILVMEPCHEKLMN